MSVIYRFPYDSPIRYLPLVYLLPCDLISRFPPPPQITPEHGGVERLPGMGRGHFEPAVFR